MKKLLKTLTKRNIFFLGLAVVFLAQIPVLILGTDTVVTYHDQLDGEIIAYIYQAKYLLSGQNIIPEFLNGALKTTLTPPAPLAVLLFCMMPPFPAYVIMQIVGQVIAYAGMFLLVDLLTENKYISIVVALLYTFLPFLPVYGLSQYGIPMLFVCFYYLYQKKHRAAAIGYIALYSGMSSLVLCGFVWVILLGIAQIWLLLRGKLKEHLEIVGTFLVMVGIYLLTNLSLLAQLLGVGESFISHKAEYTLSGGKLIDYLRTYFRYGGEHSTDYHEWILFLVIVLLVAGVIYFLGQKLLGIKKAQSKKDMLDKQQTENAVTRIVKWYRLLVLDMAVIVILCLAAALWNCDIGVNVRSHLGTLGSFQFARILWAAPALWYAALALCLAILWRKGSLIKWLGYGVSVVILGIVSFQCLKGSTIKMCVQEILLPEYETISWSDYLALGVMDQVEDYILTQEGLKIEEYQVASIGIDPSAALYHGFYCVDGYSNNYDLEYKHAFREVIAPELEKNDWLKEYYDGWGNRCYLYSAEIPGYFNIEKGTSWYNNLQLNTKALKDLGCDYILSAVYIVNAEEINLKLLREEAFETPESYYRIYIYKLDY